MVESKVYCTIIAANHQSQAVHCGKCLQGGVHLLKLVKQLRLIGQCGRRFKHVNLHKWTFRVSDWFYVWWDSEIWIKIVKHFWHPDVSTNTIYHQLNAVFVWKGEFICSNMSTVKLASSGSAHAENICQMFFEVRYIWSTPSNIYVCTSVSFLSGHCPPADKSGSTSQLYKSYNWGLSYRWRPPNHLLLRFGWHLLAFELPHVWIQTCRPIQILHCLN